MLNHDQSKAAFSRNSAQQVLQRFEPTSRGTDTDYRETGARRQDQPRPRSFRSRRDWFPILLRYLAHAAPSRRRSETAKKKLTFRLILSISEYTSIFGLAGLH